MYENPPQTYPPPPPPGPSSGLGCFAKGCLTVLAVCLLVGLMIGAFGWYVARNITPFLGDKPVAIRIFPATDEQYRAVQNKLAPFAQAVNAGQTADLSLSADDLNILVARDPQYADVRGRVYLTIAHDELSAEMSCPVNDASGRQRIYFNGRVGFDASYAGGDFTFVVRRVEPLGGHPTPSLIAWLIGHPEFSRSFSKGFNDSFHETLNRKNPATAAFLNRLRTMIIKDNQIDITAQGTADEAPVAAPAGST